ncbi:MAG TPA: hydrogenase nickel incorporation protein HypB [Vicinamibacterales bacterium]
MCDTCGCGDHELVPVDVHERILAGNEKAAAHNREHFRAAGVVAINLMGGPGAGKTAVLEATAGVLKDRKMAALAGDLATDNDAVRLRNAGITAAAITTGSACHLDAQMVHRAMHDVPWKRFDYLFIENVGNLVCPAIYDLGQAANVVALSVTEGEDKPLKYPVMFRAADLVLITKIDLLAYLPHVSLNRIIGNLERVMPRPLFLPLSSQSGHGVAEWAAWLESIRSSHPNAKIVEGSLT